jgi:EamA-like transporter family
MGWPTLKSTSSSARVSPLPQIRFSGSAVGMTPAVQVRNQARYNVLNQASNDLKSERDEIFFLTALTDGDDRKLSSADPVLIAMTKCLVAGTVNVALAILRGAALPSIEVSGGAAVVGFLGVGVSLVLFVLALRHLGTARTGAYFSLAPFVGALVAIVLLHDPLSFKLVLSGALMGFGLWMHLAERHEHEHEHDAFEHEHSHTHDEHHQHKRDGPVTEPHSHWHRHEPMIHSHPHYPDLHHRHGHSNR